MNWQLFPHYLQGFYRMFLYIMIYMYVYIYTYIPRRNKQISLHTYVYNPSHVNSFQKRNCQVSSFPQLSGQRFNQKWNHHLVRLHHSTTTLLWNPSFWKAQATFNNHHLQTTWPRSGTPASRTKGRGCCWNGTTAGHGNTRNLQVSLQGIGPRLLQWQNLATHLW